MSDHGLENSPDQRIIVDPYKKTRLAEKIREGNEARGGRKVVAEALKERSERREKLRKGDWRAGEGDYKGLSSVAQLERQLYLANLALNKYEDRLRSGEELDLQEEGMFLKHQDSVRKLETTLSALRAKADLSTKNDPELAMEMLNAGLKKPQVLSMYPNNPHVAKVVADWEEDA